MDNKVLKYSKFDKKGKKTMAGVLNFDLYSLDLEKVDGEPEQFRIKIRNNTRDFWFRAESPKECIDWMAAINMHIKESEGFICQLDAPVTETFWKTDQISERQFIDKCDTFDILLFTGNQTGNKIVRALTASEFDHAAMVLKFGSDPNEVFFIEATVN